MNCQQHLNKNYSFICLSEGCKSRLFCDECQHYQNHFLIPIQELNQKITGLQTKWIEPKLKPVLEFLKQNNQNDINIIEIDNQLQYIYDTFIEEIILKLREQQNYLSNQLKQLSQNALKNVNYLKNKINEIYNLQDINTVLQKYQNGIYSKETFEQIIKDYSIKIQGNTEIQNIYTYITNNGANHNYLDIIQIDLKQFHLYKSYVLSHLTRLQDLDNYLPIKYQLLPTKTHPIFSWNIVKGQQDHSFNIQNIPKTMNVDEIYSFKSRIICVINQNQILSYSQNFKFLNLIHHTTQFDFYLATNIQSDIQIFTLWSSPTQISIYTGFRKIKNICNASLNPIQEIKLINKYNLYQKGYETCLLTLDSNGVLKLNTLSDNNYYNFTYGQGILKITILPETKNVLKKSLSHTQDALLDLVICSYQKNQIKLAIRSLFQAAPISRIWDDETLEQKLGLIEHCEVQFTIFKLSQFEKNLIQDKMDVNGIEYAIVTLLYSTVTFWNWKNGTPLRVVDAAESYGLRTMPAIIDGTLLTLIVLIGLDGTIYCVNWLKNSVIVSKLKISDVVQIHAMSQNLTKLGESQFIVVLRHQKRPFMTVTELIYY